MDALDPIKGFGKDINDYLNHYITLTDGKAVAVATLSLAVLGFAVGAISKSCVSYLGVIFSILGVIASGWCIFPRTPSSGTGHIFWSNIANFSSATEYWKSISSLDRESVEFEYAKQNYFISQVLIKKLSVIRHAMVFLALACIATVIAYGVA